MTYSCNAYQYMVERDGSLSLPENPNIYIEDSFLPAIRFRNIGWAVDRIFSNECYLVDRDISSSIRAALCALRALNSSSRRLDREQTDRFFQLYFDAPISCLFSSIQNWWEIRLTYEGHDHERFFYEQIKGIAEIYRQWVVHMEQGRFTLEDRYLEPGLARSRLEGVQSVYMSQIPKSKALKQMEDFFSQSPSYVKRHRIGKYEKRLKEAILDTVSAYFLTLITSPKGSCMPECLVIKIGQIEKVVRIYRAFVQKAKSHPSFASRSFANVVEMEDAFEARIQFFFVQLS